MRARQKRTSSLQYDWTVFTATSTDFKRPIGPRVTLYVRSRCGFTAVVARSPGISLPVPPSAANGGPDALRGTPTDHLGFGLSERPPTFAYTPEAHAAALAEFVDRLGLDRFTLVAHDFGGPIGLPLALESPSRVGPVILMNTWMWPFDDDVGMKRRAMIAGGAVGKLLYKDANASLRFLAPSTYGSVRSSPPRFIGNISRSFSTAHRAHWCCTRWRGRCSAQAPSMPVCWRGPLSCAAGRCSSCGA